MDDIPEKAHPTEEMEQFINCINIPNRQTEKLNEQIERNAVLEEEIKKLKESMEHKDQEIAELAEKQVSEDAILASLEQWMKLQIEEVRLSNDKLNETTMEVYKEILEKGKAKAQSTIISDRQRLSEEIHKMEQLCEHLSKEILKNNEEVMQKITKHFGNILKADDLLEEQSFSENTIAAEEWIIDEQRTLSEIKKLTEEIQKIGKATLEVCMKSEQGSTLELKRMTEEIKQVGHLCEKVSTDVKKKSSDGVKEIKTTLEAYLDPTLGSLTEIKKMTDQIPKIGKVCEQVSNDVKKNREENVKEMKTTLQACINPTQASLLEIKKMTEQIPKIGNLCEKVSTDVKKTSDEIIKKSKATIEAYMDPTRESLSEIKKMTDQIPKIGNLCEKVSTEVKKKYEESMKEIKATMEVRMKSEQGSASELNKMTEEVRKVGTLCNNVSTDVKKKSGEIVKEIKATLEDCMDPTRESLTEIKKITEQMLKIGNVCEKVSFDVKKKSEESLTEVKSTLETHMDTTRTALAEIKNSSDEIPKIGKFFEKELIDFGTKYNEIFEETKTSLGVSLETEFSSETKKIRDRWDPIVVEIENKTKATVEAFIKREQLYSLEPEKAKEKLNQIEDLYLKGNAELKNRLTEKCQQEREEMKVQMGRFLGSYACEAPPWKFIIGQDAKTEYYYCHHPYRHGGQADLFVPDGLVRNGILATIDGDLLKILNAQWDYKSGRYELCEGGLKYNGRLNKRTT